MGGCFLLGVISQGEIFLYSGIILIAFIGLFAFAIISYKIQRKPVLSPYTHNPLRRGEDIPLSTVEKVMRFLYYDVHNYDNRIFRMRRSMICRQTGRVFQECVNSFGIAKVDWSFINKRYPGEYVSWGSLTQMQKDAIIECHESLEGFQTEQSSLLMDPQSVEPKYAFIKPGPLYVDIKKKVLVGWKIVPDTELEVLIVQKPKVRYLEYYHH